MVSGPDNKIFEVRRSVAQVKINGLISLTGVNFLTMQFTGHLTQDGTAQGGVYATLLFKKRLQKALNQYYQLCITSGIPEQQIVLLTSEAASLVWGGLYDVAHDYQPSHCGHRKGNALDIGMGALKRSTSTFKNDMLEFLEEALVDNNIAMPAPNERPLDINSSHWHAQQK